MPRVLFTLQYLGTRYCGWQRQENALAVQQLFEEAIETLCGSRVITEASGRTDSGVHAAAQRVHADLPNAIPERGLMLGLNNLLPPDIRVLRAVEVDESFHCRFAAKRKTYVYRIWNSSIADVFHYETHAHVPNPLDAALMQDAARALIGEHDFRTFTVPNPEVRSTVRSVYGVIVERNGEKVEIRITANGFLRYMVRRVAGLLIEVGKNKVSRDAVARALEPTFERARWTAPARGLTMESVEYDSPQPC